MEDTGKHDEAGAIYNKLIDNYVNNLTRAPNDLLWIARALWKTEDFHGANDVLKLAAQANPRNAEVFVTWGDLLAEKYNEPEAISSYQDALKIDPKMPEAHVGVARSLALAEPEKAAAALEQAMATNAKCSASITKSFPARIGVQVIKTPRDAQNAVGALPAENPNSVCLFYSVRRARR